MARHAIVNRENRVVNVVIWEGAEWLPPRDHLVVNCAESVGIGDLYNPLDNSFKRDVVTISE